jgi:hypothetical protein
LEPVLGLGLELGLVLMLGLVLVLIEFLKQMEQI